MAHLALGILVSGSGTNLQAIIDAIEAQALPVEIKLVISNVPTAQALQRAQRHGIPARVIDHHDFPTREAFDQALIAAFDSAGVQLVCLAGFMRILTQGFVRHYHERLMNIHPALLPAFKGLWGHHVHEAVLKSGARVSGCTVHFVTEDVDGGPIITQRVVSVLDDDTPDGLAARVLAEEHNAYPEAIRLFAEGRLQVVGSRVKVRP